MLDTLRTRFGRFLLVILLLCVAGVILVTSDSAAGSEDSRGIAILGTIREYVSGSRMRTPAERISSKANAKKDSKAGKDKAAAKSEEFRTSTTLTGNTLDETGKPLKDVNITVRRAGTVDVIKSGKSNDKGIFSLDSLPAGTYDVLAKHDQFVPLIRPGFTIYPHQQELTIDFHMPLGAEIKGIIKDEDGKTLANVRVAARKQKAEESKNTGEVLIDDATYQTQLTDTAGTFTLTGIAQGPNVFEFALPGYAVERMTVDVTPKVASEQMKVTLKRTGTIVGTVLDTDNNPVSTATVALTRFKPLQGEAQTLDKEKMKVTTDANGQFKFEKLYNEGYYDLIVEEPSYAPGIFPLVLANTQGIVCQIGRGGEITGETKLIDRPVVPVSVLVKATTVINGTTFTQEARSDGNGKFRLSKLPYGSYDLKVDDGKFLSEPKDGVKLERDKALDPITMEIYQTARVSGRVTDTSTETPVANAKVTLRATYGVDKTRNKTFTINADAHGMFELRTLPAGIHVAQAEARGYLKGQTDRSQQNFVLVPGERKNDLNLFLDRGGSVEGFILDADGRSVDDANVQLFAATTFHGAVKADDYKATTDGTGYFKIWGIEVGERVQLYASASKTGHTKARSDMIELSPKQMNQAVQILMPAGGQVTGIVTDENDMPIPGAEVHFTSSAFPGDPSPSDIKVHTEPNGTYRIENCPAGGGSIRVSRAGFVSKSRGVTIRNEKTQDNINFELELGRTIAGVVSDLDGYPIAGARVTASGINGAAGSESDVTNKRGEFELNNLGRGEFRLDANFTMDTPEGKQNYRFTNPKVRSGDIHVAIDCDLGNTTSGKVKGEKGRGIPNFTVTLNSKTNTKPSQDFVFNLSRGMKDAAGYFRMSKLPRGIYKLTVSADGYEPYVEEEIAIGPHRRTVLSEIRLNPAGGVIGRVFSSTSDRPVNSASVRLESVDELPTESPRVVTGSTNMRGEFRLSTVPEGTYKVSINHPSYIGMKMEMIQVTEKKERDLGKLFLEPGGAIRGTVTNQQGDPLPGMTVTVKGVTPAKQASTDAAGNYLIQGVQFGRWPVVVNGTMAGKPMYVFQTSDIQRDETERVDFTLEQSSNLRGRLIATAENSVKSAKVQIHPFDENNIVLENISYDTNARSAQYEIDKVPPGQYFLWASGNGSNGSFTSWRGIFLDRGNNWENLQVGSAEVSGKVTAADGSPAADAGVQLLPIFNSPQLTRNLYNRLIKPTSTNSDGTFTFKNLQPGSYQLLNQNMSGWYAQPVIGVRQGERLQALNIMLNE